MISKTPANLCRKRLVQNNPIIVFTCAHFEMTDVSNIDISNSSEEDALVELYLVPFESTVPLDVNGALLPGVTVKSKDIYQWEGLQVMHPGDRIECFTDNRGITVQVSGYTYRK